MRCHHLLTILLFVVIAPSISLAQFSNRGTDFWVGYQSTGTLNVAMKVYISALSTGDSVTITTMEGTPNQWKKTYWVAPNTTIISDDIPATLPYDVRLVTEGFHAKKGIHITSRGVPVSAYVHMYGSASSGSTMLLPVSVLGAEHHILNITQNYGSGNYSVFHLVAPKDSTWVEINPSVQTQAGWTQGGGPQDNGSYLVKLNKGDVYQVLASSITTDLTGSTVRSVPNAQGITNPLAVFGGSTRTRLACSSGGTSGGDLIIGQVFPTQVWGKKFATAPFSTSTTISTLAPTIYRIIVKDSTTQVRRNGVVLTNLTASSFYQFESNTPQLIVADKPIMVAQYMTGACNVGVADPEMIYISPLSEAIAKTAFFRTTMQNITVNYLTLIIPNAGLSSLKIDGVPFNGSSSTYSYAHPNLPGYTVAVKRWTATQSQCIVESNYAFTGVTYGMGSVESYGYNIGAQFDSLNLQEVKYNTIRSTLFLDRNNNAVRDAGEPLYNYAKIQTIKAGIDTSYTYSPTGESDTYTDTGSYVTKAIPLSPYYSAVPASRSSNFTTYHNRDSIDFAIQSIGLVRDMFAGIIATTPARPGFNASYQLGYGNKGTDTADVVISLAKSNKLTLMSATVTPSSVTADTIKWNLAALKPTEAGSIAITFKLAIPPALVFNDTLKFTALISSAGNEQTPADNSLKLRQRVTGSYDPNDKQERNDGQISASAINAGESLNYTIRFQNTGTDTAFNIVIRDTLSQKLNWSSLKMIAASHLYQLTLNDGIAVWSFNDVNLVDSNTNEPLSHGFISFSIDPVASVAAGDVIGNRASIYFDYNLPILTNEALTTITADVLPVSLISFTATRQETKNVLNWKIARQQNFSHFELERSENGKDFTSIGKVSMAGEEYHFEDITYRRTMNYYRLKMVDKDGKFEYSPIKSINNQGMLDVSVYPNPAEHTLQVRIEHPLADQIQIQVISMEGRVLQAVSLKVNAGLTIEPINVSSLSTGTYILRIINSNKESSILKFNKQ